MLSRVSPVIGLRAVPNSTINRQNEIWIQGVASSVAGACQSGSTVDTPRNITVQKKNMRYAYNPPLPLPRQPQCLVLTIVARMMHYHIDTTFFNKYLTRLAYSHATRGPVPRDIRHAQRRRRGVDGNNYRISSGLQRLNRGDNLSSGETRPGVSQV